MASALTDKLSRLVKEMRGQARITESNVQDMLREVRMALLEADVALPVVRDFIARVKEKALGQEVLGSLKPGQALVGIVNAELSATIANNLENDRTAVSGVNLDEEAAKLLQYQQAYQASAKMLQIAQSVFDTLIQNLGR